MARKRDNMGDLLEPRADEINREKQPDWETIGDVKEKAAWFGKNGGASRAELAELEQLADDAVPKNRPEIRDELARVLAAVPVRT